MENLEKRQEETLLYDFSHMSRFEAAGFLNRFILNDLQVSPECVNIPSKTLEERTLIIKLISIKALSVAISCLLEETELDETEKEIATNVYISDGERLKKYLKGSRYEEILHQWKIYS